MAKIIPGLLFAAVLAVALWPSQADAQGVSNTPLEGLWIGRFFGSDADAAKAAPSAFCGAHPSSFQELYFQFGRVNAVLADEYGFRLELAGAFIGRNFIGEVRLTNGEGLELLGPAKGVLGGAGQARISIAAKDLGGKSDRICNAIFRMKPATAGD